MYFQQFLIAEPLSVPQARQYCRYASLAIKNPKQYQDKKYLLSILTRVKKMTITQKTGSFSPHLLYCLYTSDQKCGKLNNYSKLKGPLLHD